MKRKVGRGLGVLAAVLTVLGVAGSGLMAAERQKMAPAKEGGNPLPKLSIDETPLPKDIKARTSYAPVIKKISPSVVNIYSTVTIRERQVRCIHF
jgi:S1-C subfamily serine protease